MLGFCFLPATLGPKTPDGREADAPEASNTCPLFRTGQPGRVWVWQPTPGYAGAGPGPDRVRHAIPVKYYFDCGSSNGRTAGLGPANGGSNPPPRAVTRCRWTNWSGRLSVKEECTGSSPVRHPHVTLWTRSLIGKASPCDGGEWQFESARVHKPLPGSVV